MRRLGRRSTRSTRNPRNKGLLPQWSMLELFQGLHWGVSQDGVLKEKFII